MTEIKHQAKEWKFVYEPSMGVTSISNDRLNFFRPWDTGMSAQEELREVSVMTEQRFIKYCELQWHIFKNYSL